MNKKENLSGGMQIRLALGLKVPALTPAQA